MRRIVSLAFACCLLATTAYAQPFTEEQLQRLSSAEAKQMLLDIMGRDIMIPLAQARWGLENCGRAEQANELNANVRQLAVLAGVQSSRFDIMLDDERVRCCGLRSGQTIAESCDHAAFIKMIKMVNSVNSWFERAVQLAQLPYRRQ